MSVKKLKWAFVLTLIAMLWIVFILSCVYAQTVRRSEEIGVPPKLETQLIMYKNQYLLREPIWVKVQVKNVGDKSGKFYFVNIDGLVIKDSNGKIYPCNVAIERIPITINPGQTLEKEFDVLTWYGVKEDSFWVRYYLPPEKYDVYYQVENDVQSESDSFSILEPRGDELKAMNLLKQAYDLRIQKKHKESLEKLKELIQKYPNSRYYLYALLLSAGSLDAWYDLVRRFPDSREALQAVGSIALTYEYRKDKKGFIDAMNNLIKKYPNTDIATEAENRLKQMKDKDFE